MTAQNVFLRPSDEKGKVGPKCQNCPHRRGDHFNNGEYKGCDGGVRYLKAEKPWSYCLCVGFVPVVELKKRAPRRNRKKAERVLDTD